MPSPTLTPDHSAAPGRPVCPPEAATPGRPSPSPEPATPGRPSSSPEAAIPSRDIPAILDPDVPNEPPAAPGLRLIAVPAGWPPYDCETHGATCRMSNGLVTSGPAARTTPPAEPAFGSGPAALATPPAEPAPGPAAVARAGTAPVTAGLAPAWPRQFAQVIVEILAGSRPPRQIIPWTTDRVRAQVVGLTRLFASDQRPRLQRIMTSQPAVSVVEMTMVISFGPRSRAMALRFEHRPARPDAPGRPARPARWLCTEIEAG